jgi:hypothetical protein
MRDYKYMNSVLPFNNSVFTTYKKQILLGTLLVVLGTMLYKFTQEPDPDLKEYFRLQQSRRKLDAQKAKAVKARVEAQRLLEDMPTRKKEVEERLRQAQGKIEDAQTIEKAIAKREKKLLKPERPRIKKMTQAQLLKDIQERQLLEKVTNGEKSFEVGNLNIGGGSVGIAKEGVTQLGGIGKQAISTTGDVIGGTVSGGLGVVKEGVTQIGKAAGEAIKAQAEKRKAEIRAEAKKQEGVARVREQAKGERALAKLKASETPTPEPKTEPQVDRPSEPETEPQPEPQVYRPDEETEKEVETAQLLEFPPDEPETERGPRIDELTEERDTLLADEGELDDADKMRLSELNRVIKQKEDEALTVVGEQLGEVENDEDLRRFVAEHVQPRTTLTDEPTPGITVPVFKTRKFMNVRRGKPLPSGLGLKVEEYTRAKPTSSEEEQRIIETRGTSSDFTKSLDTKRGLTEFAGMVRSYGDYDKLQKMIKEFNRVREAKGPKYAKDTRWIQDLVIKRAIHEAERAKKLRDNLDYIEAGPNLDDRKRRVREVLGWIERRKPPKKTFTRIRTTEGQETIEPPKPPGKGSSQMERMAEEEVEEAEEETEEEVETEEEGEIDDLDIVKEAPPKLPPKGSAEKFGKKLKQLMRATEKAVEEIERREAKAKKVKKRKKKRRGVGKKITPDDL